MPAKAGIQASERKENLDSRFRGNHHKDKIDFKPIP
jgi:hypothetical protein